MKIMIFFVYILIPLAVIFFYTGCSPVIPNPDPTPMPTRIPLSTPGVITGLREGTTIPTGDASVIVSQGNYLYYTGGNGNTGNLGIINFSNPSYPIIMGTETIGYGQGIAVNGNYLYVQMDAGNDWNDCVASFDVSDPYNLVYEDEESIGYYTGCPIYYRNGYLYNCSFSALSIYNVTDPKNISYITEIPTTFCIWVAFQDNYLYMSDDMKLIIYDISTPSSPEFTGQVMIAEGGNGGIAVNGNYAYVGDQCAGEKIYIIDVSIPSKPAYKDSFLLSTTGVVDELKVVSHYLLGVTEFGFFVLDIAEPLYPVEVSVITTIPNCGWGFTICGKYAIVSDDTMYHVIELLSD